MSDLSVRVADGVLHRGVLDQLVADRVASRIAGGDATLWGPGAEDSAAQRLGWVRLPHSSRALRPVLSDLVQHARAEGLDHVVLCGMGGSSLAPEVITRTAGVELTVLDTTDPSAVRRVIGDRLRSTVVVVSSKSGSTLETDSQRRAYVEAFRAAGIDAASRIVVVTDPGSALEQLARAEGYRAVVLADPQVGGRYSALSAFGLVPSVLAGADVDALLEEAAAVADQLGTDDVGNPALVLGAALGRSATPTSGSTRDKVAIADAGSGIVGFADWAEQLLAESTGKESRGILPIAVESVDAPEVTRPPGDVLALVLTDSVADAPGTAHAAVSGPLGAQLLLWEYATAVAGRLLGIDPFDQPDVESAKKAARGLLDAPSCAEPAAFTDQGIEVRGSASLLDGARTLRDALAALQRTVGSGGYLGVMAYLDPVADAAVADTRMLLAVRTARAVTFGWGPRFLHSTGQYHKGGPAEGSFLQITGAVAEDLAVPDRPFSFGELIGAQAAGDAAVLADHGRPVLRLHLTDRASGVATLRDVLG